MEHIDDKTMYGLIDGSLTDDARHDVLSHIDGCGECKARLESLADVEKTLRQAWSKFREEECPAPEVLHAYSESALSEEESAKIRDHLGRCDVCSLILAEGLELAEEYARQEEVLLADNRQRLGDQLYEKVKRFLQEKFTQADDFLEQVDMFAMRLQPVPVFRGAKPAKRRVRRIPVVCKDGYIAVEIEGEGMEGKRARLLDQNETEVRECIVSAEGVITFFDIEPGYYIVEVDEEEPLQTT